MANNYVEIPVKIQLDKTEDIYKRLQVIAKASNTTTEDMLAFLLTVGINHHLRCNITKMEYELGIK